MRILSLLLVLLIAYSCTRPEVYRRDAWYKISGDTPPDTSLISEKIYDSNNRLLMDVSWNPSLNAFKNVIVYNEDEKVKERCIYYDTTMLNGQKISYKYDQGEVVEQVFIFFNKDLKNDTVVARQINTFNEAGQLIESAVIAGEDTSRLVHSYNKEGLPETTSFIPPSGLVRSTRTCIYDEKGNLVINTIEFPGNQSTRTEFNSFRDTVLVSMILVENGDTIRQERYTYENGRKSEIEITDRNDHYRVIIINEKADRLPDIKTLYTLAR